MGELSVTTIVGLGGFVIGLVFGAVVQRTNFCTMGGISDLVLMGDGRRFRAWLLAIAVAIIGTQALYFGGVIDINKSIYLSANLGWLGAIIGGAMFGFGMTQTGGCASRTLVRLGSGNLKSLIVMLVLGIFAYMTLRGLLALPRLQIETTNIDLTTRGLDNQNLGEMAGAAHRRRRRCTARAVVGGRARAAIPGHLLQGCRLPPQPGQYRRRRSWSGLPPWPAGSSPACWRSTNSIRCSSPRSPSWLRPARACNI